MLQMSIFRPNSKRYPHPRLFAATPSQELFAQFSEYPWFDFFAWLS